MKNLQISNLYDNLINSCTSSDLPVGTIYFVLKDVFRDIEQVYFEAIETEYLKQNQEQEVVELSEEEVEQLNNDESVEAE